MKKKKKIMTAATAALLALACLCGCAYNTYTLFCGGHFGEFTMEYKIYRYGGYDGREFTFTVKDGFEFELYLTGLDTFDGTLPLTDRDGIAYTFLSGGEKFFAYEREANRYGLASCLMEVSLDDGGRCCFEFPPTTSLYFFKNGNAVETNLTWEEFSLFYEDLPYSEVFPEGMCAVTACYASTSKNAETTGTVTLFSADGTVTAVPELYDAQEDENS